ncbi:methylation-associated defense system AAA family ATPase MAD3 [Chloroflexus sp.]|uniref:methylation-associated defense system AAA family ATPase MAD3 n=1 Tax=Chloroflexus sp. TaxID=1904827 RepID=UPI002ADD7F3D|nr:AAA family ATPase [Chloroflexus sp.]
MFQKVEIARYKCIKYASISLSPFNILIGPNASGKSTFLDSLAFIRDALETDVERAIRRRASSLRELVWLNEADQGFEVAVEVQLPDDLKSNGYDRMRYEVGIGLDVSGAIAVAGENLWMVNTQMSPPAPPKAPVLFPTEPTGNGIVVRPARKKPPAGYRLIVRKVVESGNDYFRSEKTDWNFMLRFSPQRLALSGIPEDQDRFPTALWFRQAMLRNIQVLQLNSALMRRVCPSDAPRTFQADGSNLPVMVKLLQADAQRFSWWTNHLQTILEDLEAVGVTERPEDRSFYLVLTYRNGVAVPAWLLSDGTLRLLALTLLAYLPNQHQVFIIEEPENGIHPKAVEAVFNALRSVYDGQVFLATHSPLVLALARPEDLLVFGKTPSGATDIVNGPFHPVLREWQRETSLDTLFAAGVLG